MPNFTAKKSLQSVQLKSLEKKAKKVWHSTSWQAICAQKLKVRERKQSGLRNLIISRSNCFNFQFQQYSTTIVHCFSFSLEQCAICFRPLTNLAPYWAHRHFWFVCSLEKKQTLITEFSSSFFTAVFLINFTVSQVPTKSWFLNQAFQIRIKNVS